MAIMVFTTGMCSRSASSVAIGGGISAAEALLPAIQAELDWLFERCTVMPTVKPELVRCRYGNDANLIGALKLFFEQNPA
ncbi:hypothetical protein [Faecalibacterium prausnitzii]|uniref:hypothetical protein n=2 Tax=Faecalibacterium prausnitzii TaxID=853 RepID=UPI001FAB0B0C|nr:hypothetical protein [Faecalibacterium prausnitzii]